MNGLKNGIVFFGLVAAAALPLSAQVSQVPNASFENWTDCQLDNWADGNLCGSFTPFTKSTDAHTGSFAARGEVVAFSGAQIPPFLQAGSDAEGFPVTERNSSVDGFYKFAPVGGDQFGVTAIFLKGGPGGTPIGQGAQVSSNAISTYTKFSVPVTYSTADVPDTCMMQIFIAGSSEGGYHTGSVMFVDDISLGAPSVIVSSPTLSVALNGSSVVVSWPQNVTGFRLETSTTLAPGSWTSVTPQPDHTYNVTPANTPAFFRLANP